MLKFGQRGLGNPNHLRSWSSGNASCQALMVRKNDICHSLSSSGPNETALSTLDEINAASSTGLNHSQKAYISEAVHRF